MPDMLVNLLKIAPVEAEVQRLRGEGVVIRRAHPFELTPIRAFIEKHFSVGWADEITPCISRQPVSLFIAVREGRVLGFAAYEGTRRNFFGPTGVLESERKRGIGNALLLSCLWGLREMGYAYAIIGSAGPTKFYRDAAGATEIPDSTPGIYTDLLKQD